MIDLTEQAICQRLQPADFQLAFARASREEAIAVSPVLQLVECERDQQRFAVSLSPLGFVVVAGHNGQIAIPSVLLIEFARAQGITGFLATPATDEAAAFEFPAELSL